MHAVFADVSETERFQTAKVTFKITKARSPVSPNGSIL